MSQHRLNEIKDGYCLNAEDKCYFVGEYIAHAKWDASPTNQLISNLKADLRRKPQRASYKSQAINTAAFQIATCGLNLEALRTACTVVPMPCSKPPGHEDYDDRMLRVVNAFGQRVGLGFDGRELLVTTAARPAQHASGSRATIAELVGSMTVNQLSLVKPLRSTIIVVDDVFTKGASFKAAQQIVSSLPGVEKVYGLFVARTVWPQNNVDLSAFLNSLA
ncbi:hypothetical protein [Xanthomonas axonopodis]|uniref:hypothetical protein n=1 Tax=Xanthomonas axonopodis TaxID=53413 RepID=UPI001117253A|nr:hypothetical protein [Xanthomonas axonopodis]